MYPVDAAICLRQHRTIPALRLKHRSGSCGTGSALPKCSIMSGCGTRIVLRGQKPLALCDRCPCFGSLFPPLAALTFAASSIICAFGLASAAPRSPYRHLELCGLAFTFFMGASGAPSTDSPEGTECVEELQKKNQITGPRQWISMALKYWMASFLVISPLSTRSSLAKASSPTCSMVLSPVMIRPAFRSISFSMRW